MVSLAVSFLLISFTGCEPESTFGELEESVSNDYSTYNESGETTYCSGSAYTPYGDIQVDSFCQTACSYKAQNYTPGVEYSCNIITGFGLSSSKCPAC